MEGNYKKALKKMGIPKRGKGLRTNNGYKSFFGSGQNPQITVWSSRSGVRKLIHAVYFVLFIFSTCQSGGQLAGCAHFMNTHPLAATTMTRAQLQPGWGILVGV